MFDRWRRDPIRREIAESATKLVPRPDDELMWNSPMVGHFILENITHVLIMRDLTSVHTHAPCKSLMRSPYFRLSAMLIRDTETDLRTVSQTSFSNAGYVFGVTNHVIDTSEVDKLEIRKSISFQVENGLTDPGPDDYTNLLGYLRLAKLDAIPLHSIK